jgi:hypothetical protein
MNDKPPTLGGSTYIALGSAYNDGVQIGGAPQYIQSSTNANPIVLTIPEHGFTNGEIVIVDTCANLGANGTWIVESVTTDTFALTGANGTNYDATTTQSGIVAPAVDGTGSKFYVLLRTDSITKNVSFLFTNDGTPTAPLFGLYTLSGTVNGTFSFASVNAISGITIQNFIWGLTGAQSALITNTSFFGSIWKIDTANVVTECGFFEIKTGT